MTIKLNFSLLADAQATLIDAQNHLRTDPNHAGAWVRVLTALETIFDTDDYGSPSWLYDHLPHAKSDVDWDLYQLLGEYANHLRASTITPAIATITIATEPKD